MKCDLVVVSWNHLEHLRPCVEHIVQNTHYPYRLIIVDNASDPETIDYLVDLEKNAPCEIVVIKNKDNRGFVKAVNQGLKISTAPYACIFNNDTLPGNYWLTEMVEFASMRPDVGLLNPMSSGHNANNLTVNEYAAKLLPNKGMYMEMNQCQGYCMLVKREVMEKIGYLDERFDTVGFDDTDYSMRAYLAGYKSVCVHSSYVFHRLHASFGKMGDRKEIQSVLENRYFAKWPRHLRVAIAFSLTKDTHDIQVENFLNSALFLAREWCWVNLMIFGDKTAGNRIDTIREKMDFPLHQNIKLNYLNPRFKFLEIAVRILERSFGRKKRKKYDIFICDNASLLEAVKMLCSLQKSNALLLDFHEFSEKKLEESMKPFRKDGLKEKNTGSLRCDIILPVCDQYEFTKNCIDSIVKNTDTPYRLIIINNGNNPKTHKLLDELEAAKNIETSIVHNGRNIGWVKALNVGIEISDAPYVCFQNDDTIVTQGWLRKMIATLKSGEDFGMINPTWEGRPSSVSIDRYNAMLETGAKKFIKTDWCRGFSALMKRSVIEKVGKVDEVYGLAYFDDVDYAVRAAEAGFQILRALDTYVYHHRNVTFFEVLKGKRWNELHEKNKRIYYKKWGRPLKLVMVLDKKMCNDPRKIEKVEETMFYLARKQHHIDIWMPRRIKDRFEHTNIRLRVCPWPFLAIWLPFNLHLNKRKRNEKRYNAVFNYDSGSDEYIKETVDSMKEKTKESINVEL